MKELKDYAPFYLGCEVIGTYDDKPREGYLTGVNNGGYDCEIQFFEEDGINVFEHPVFNTIDKIKLILRPLSDMTDEEEGKVKCSNWTGMQHGEWEYTIESFRFLLSKHFDLFGLIEAGLAVNAAELKSVSSR